MSLKENIMNNMMDKQFGNISSEEKQKMMEAMMDKFFSGMSDDEKQEMMQNMMSKMMGGTKNGTGTNPMMGMMAMMMGRKMGNSKEGDAKVPWDFCKEMMSGYSGTPDKENLATPELRSLFNEWCEQIEKEILEAVKDKGTIDIDELSTRFHVSTDSMKYLLGRLEAKNVIDFKQ